MLREIIGEEQESTASHIILEIEHLRWSLVITGMKNSDEWYNKSAKLLLTFYFCPL